METLFIALVSGLAGGLLLAVLIAVVPRRIPANVVPRRLAEPSTALINMAAIRVEGVGGLGMVAAVVLVAATDPRIRAAITLALVLGIALAFVLIAIRRRTDPLPSGGGTPYDRSTLRLEGGPGAISPAPTDPPFLRALSPLTVATMKRSAGRFPGRRAHLVHGLPKLQH